MSAGSKGGITGGWEGAGAGLLGLWHIVPLELTWHVVPIGHEVPLPQSTELDGTQPPPIEHLLPGLHKSPFPQSSPIALVVSFVSFGSGTLPAGNVIQIWSILD